MSQARDNAARAKNRFVREFNRTVRRIHPPRPDWYAGTSWEAVRTSGLFDDGWYRATYADAATSPDPLWHYATIGARKGHDPNPLFSTSWYLAAYPDVAASGTNPLVHYLEFGAHEGRDPSPSFDTDWYLRTNIDLRTADVNPLGHYLVAGGREGRRPRAIPRRPLGDSTVSVVIVSGEPDTPGHAYRVVRFAEAVAAIGGSATVLNVTEAASTHIAALDTADVVVLWRTIGGPEIEHIVERSRRGGAVIVFDVDDLMFDPDIATVTTVDGIRSQGFSEPDVRDMFAKVRRSAEISDACTCPTPELATRLRRLGKPVFVLPNGFDDAVFLRSRLAVRLRRAVVPEPLCRIGYASGSRTHQRDFALLAPAVADVLRAHPEARLVLFRRAFELDEFPIFDDLRDQIEWRELVPLEDLPLELSRFDINLAPLEVGNPFCEAKSALKFFEAALVDVPTIASPTGPFRAVIADGVTGFLADGVDEWHMALSTLVADPALRQAVGRAARVSALWEHGPTRRAQAVQAILAQLLDTGIASADAFQLELARTVRPQAAPPAVGEASVVFERDSLREARVTVVIPVHNYERRVTEALESVRSQTLDDLDLVVVDDGSSDRSLDVARQWIAGNHERFNRVLVLSHTENAGLARARNTGFSAAETPFVLPLDADNALLPRCCEALLEAIDESAAAFSYPAIRLFGETTELFPEEFLVGQSPYSAQRLVASNYIDAMALVRTSAWAAVGGYREGLLGWEDYDLWCRFAEAGLYGAHVLDELARYRVHHESMLHTTTNRDEHATALRELMAREHPWLQLEQEPEARDGSSDMTAAAAVFERVRERPAVDDAPPVVTHERDVAPEAGRLSERARELLPLLRCPQTGEPLEELPEGGLRSTITGRRWPVVAGRPSLFPGRDDPEVMPPEHLGNPLPTRARHLVSETNGLILHLSGGGTNAGNDRVVELDAAIFGPTDIVGDSHHLPFGDETFDLVIAMNAFEHYREPDRVVAQIERVLRPGGLVFLHTAFLQPVHEAPHHYFNCTAHGLRQWFNRFETLDLNVSDNFHPGYALAWLASDIAEVLAQDLSPEAAQSFRNASIGTFADFWSNPDTRAHDERWDAFPKLTPPARERLAAGFEYLGRRPRAKGTWWT
jgi:GT2 family glycosyltransferase/glycosyltransferase involved in cell wall biosynthesis/SAM-dependent methyltransferase